MGNDGRQNNGLIMDTKYPGQEKASPVGRSPTGFWSDPSVKEGDSDIHLAEALRHFIANPDKIGTPTHINEAEKKVIFDNGKTLSFDDVISHHKNSTTEKDSSFFDGPVDLGKEHDGDFPSVSWMPRGQEDLDVTDTDLTASTKVAATLDETLLTQAIEKYVNDNKYDIDWFDKYGEKFVDNLREDAYEAGRSRPLSDENIDNILDNMDAEKWYEHFAESEIDSWHDTLEGITTEEDLAETYPQILSAYKQLKPQVQMKFQSSLDTLPEEYKQQIAAKYGVEYISGLNHYNDAVKNKHPKDRAIQYAVEEEKKKGVIIDPTVLMTVVKTYST